MTDSLSNPLNGARFWRSATTLDHLPPDEGAEVAFAGRSNAGKSSALNTLTGQRSLARVSKTPGRTQELLFFRIDDARRLVDLPGYGYAATSAARRRDWGEVIPDYFATRRSLRGLLLFMDIRHPLQAGDRQLIQAAAELDLPVQPVLTKADKLARGALHKALREVAKELAGLYSVLPPLPLSNLNGDGAQAIRELVRAWLDGSAAETAGAVTAP
ncbi:MAG: ribosome biogenesis GTP-binding protein YihA/YsxC [Immundisolibacter sp.]|uniref:ribosome biogenesis GTP-binding protein YihA/YsxC n=1 Tax=Immundisolibacter sp. TaxID=1934948 RepID=UPI003D0B7FEF